MQYVQIMHRVWNLSTLHRCKKEDKKKSSTTKKIKKIPRTLCLKLLFSSILQGNQGIQVWVVTLRDTLRDSIPFLQFKKREEHPWGSVTLSMVAQALACNVTKNNTPQGVLFTFFKFHKWYQIAQYVSIICQRIHLWEKNYYFYDFL